MKQIERLAPYNTKRDRRIRNEEDFIFGWVIELLNEPTTTSKALVILIIEYPVFFFIDTGDKMIDYYRFIRRRNGDKLILKLNETSPGRFETSMILGIQL